MTFRFATGLPLLVIGLLLLLTGAFTIAVYARYQLPAPWKRILPVLRGSVLVLLVLALMEPVMSRVQEVREEAHIAVIMDTSKSMNCVDAWTDEELLETANALGQLKTHDLIATFERAEEALEAARLLAQVDSFDLQRLGEQLDVFEQAVPSPGALAYVQPDQPEANAAYRPWQTTLKRIQIALFKAAVPDAPAPDLTAQFGQLATGLQAYRQAAISSVLAHDQVKQVLAALHTKTRRELCDLLLEGGETSLLHRLNKRGKVSVFSLAEPVSPIHPLDLPSSRQHASRQGSVIADVLDILEDRPVAAVVLISDGNVTGGLTLQELRPRLDSAGTLLITVGAARDSPPQDVRVHRLQAPRSVFAGNSLLLQADVSRHGFADQWLKLSLTRNGKLDRTLDLAPGPDTRVVTFHLREDLPGRYRYALHAEVLDGESIPENNRAELTLDVLGDSMRVLLLEGFPRWEARFLEQFMSEDRRIDYEARYLDVRSRDSEDRPLNLDQYDLLILGDVDPRALSAANIQNIRSFVVDQGGTLVALAGPRHMPAAWQLTPLGRLLPVRPAVNSGTAAQHRNRPVYSTYVSLEAADGLVQLAESASDSRELWEQLPGLSWLRADTQTAINADTLVATESGPPLLARANVGLGQILYVGSDEFWRWRVRAGPQHHRRIWNQLLFSGTRAQTSAGGTYVRLSTSHTSITPGETIIVRARLFDTHKAGLTGATASVMAYDSDGTPVRSAAFSPLSDVSNEYQARLEGLPIGTYTLRPSVLGIPDEDISAAVQVDVREDTRAEFEQLALNRNALVDASDTYLPFAEFERIPELVPEQTSVRAYRQDRELWGSVGFFLVVLLLLGMEWQLRKLAQLA